ncbi:transketolase [Herpetosiphon llansteffanensis]
MTQAHTLDELAINTIRMLAVDGVQAANSGHPGLPMGAAAMAYVLWTRHLKHNPANPDWADRDRFVLSAGHGSMLLYSLLHLTGYSDMALDDLKNFRQWHSKTAGHPEYGYAAGIETTTGPLGQGFATGVGMAIAARHLAGTFNQPELEIVKHHIYAIVSDGDLEEGISAEAASLAGHLKLGELVYLYDDNEISIEGDTSIAFTEDVPARFRAYGWHVQEIDGLDTEQVDAALTAAKAVTDQPSLIVAHTVIGFGSPNRAGTAKAHGSPLGPDEVKLTKEALGWPLEPTFYIPEEVSSHFRQALTNGAAAEQAWNELFERYAAAHPEKAADFKQRMSGELPDGWDSTLPVWEADAKGVATRKSSEAALNALAEQIPALIGGSADLAESTFTLIEHAESFQPATPQGRNMHWGIREHAMVAAVNGMALHGGTIPYGATFLVFSDYCRASIRLAALMGIRTIQVFTHDSIGVGEDGPTHQPIEHIPALRIIPNLNVLRPGDANETSQAWRVAVTHKGPSLLALTRQNLPTLDRSRYASAEGVAQGGYVLADSDGQPELIIIATGSELQHAVAAYEQLSGEGVKVRVVSMPSTFLFDAQSAEYRESVLPKAVTKRIAIEAAHPVTWYKYVGTDGDIIGIDHFGASAPINVLMKEFGFTAENLIARAKALLAG